MVEPNDIARAAYEARRALTGGHESWAAASPAVKEQFKQHVRSAMASPAIPIVADELTSKVVMGLVAAFMPPPKRGRPPKTEADAG